ncbi:hypothetical protein [Pseudomonas sp. dw_612]|uniref:hypothetical protein n=1 Tax=Pseudomonas sp. dw_612 TaxID=2720080 RepID=UPI001BD6D3E7|nr:hypothetical protein [Pseudomonas sp. dw_612]
MTIQYFDSPFHVTHDGEVASKIAGEMELSILADCIKKPGVKEDEAAVGLDVIDSRASELATGRIE